MDAVINWLWQGGIVTMALSLLLFALARARANVRYVVCWTAALLIVALPALPSLHVAAGAPDTFGVAPIGAMVSLPDAWWTSTLVMLSAWLLWAATHIVRFLSAAVAVRRARARCRAFPPHVEAGLPHWRRVRADGRRAPLVLSDSVSAAAVLGWGVPLIAVAPSLVRTLDAEELDRVLIHEWAHVQRRDDLVNILQVAVRMVAGWHPALWWIDRRLRVEREIACDEITVAITGSSKSYAECLVKLASLGRPPRAMRMAPAAVTASGLRRRVSKLMSPYVPMAPAWSRCVAAAIITMLLLMGTGLSAVKLVESSALAPPFDASSVARVAISPAGMVPQRPPQGASGRAPSVKHEGAKPRPPAAPPQPTIDSDAPPTEAPAMEAMSAAPAAADPAREEALATAAPTSAPPLAVSSLTGAELERRPGSPQSPWMAAAAGGAALGRKSKDAGIVTADFFTRFGRRVARSF